jgi:hypothetical protein
MCRQLILPSTAQNALRELRVSSHWLLGPTWVFAAPPLTKNPGYASVSYITGENHIGSSFIHQKYFCLPTKIADYIFVC